MDTKTTDAVEQRRTGMGAGTKAGLLVVCVLLAAVALLVGLRLARPGALPGVEVAGVEVGGLDAVGLEERLEAIGEALAAEQIALARVEPREVSEVTVTRTTEELGYRLDVDRTSERVLARGRQSNPLVALSDHFRAFRSTTDVEPAEVLDDARLAAAIDDLADALDLTPVEGAVGFDAGEVRHTDAAPGAEVDRDGLLTRVRTAVLSAGDAEVEVPVEVDRPAVGQEDVEAAVDQARTAMSGTVVLQRGEIVIPLGPAPHLSDILRFERDESAARGQRLQLVADPDVLAVAVPDTTEDALATDPVDARPVLESDTVTIVPSVEGFRFDPVLAAEQVRDLALQPDPAARTAELAGRQIPPARTTEDAEALGITEKVSEFTTYHACCQGRVTNIQQMARTVDGHVIEPGETFSLNDFIGPRTRAKGYVGGGAILNGEYIEAVGGGVSQFTTTMYNAAFFGGYAIPDHKAHSYYISRYPAGREATLHYPTVDLKITNNSPHGILVDTSYTSTSITVAFWGTLWVEVGESTGPRHNFREAETQYRDDPTLPEGQERVVQSPSTGFDIVVTRSLRFPDGREEQEEIFTRYLPQPRIVERGTQPVEPPEDAEAQEVVEEATEDAEPQEPDEGGEEAAAA